MLCIWTTYTAVSAPSGQQLTTALQGESRWRVKQGKRRSKKASSAFWENVLHTIIVSCKSHFAVQETSPSVSVQKTGKGFPPSSGSLLDSTGRKRDVHLSAA